MHIEKLKPQVLRQTYENNQFFIDGVGVEELVATGQYSKGTLNHGVFRLPGEPARLIKIFDSDFKTLLGSYEEVASTLRAQSVPGTPKIYAWGQIEMTDGRSFPYVEMEEMFAGFKTRTFKGIYDESFALGFDEKKVNLEFLGEGEEATRLTAQMAKLWVQAWEDGLVPEDADFIYAFLPKRDGTTEYKVGWIDTAHWFEFENSGRNKFQMDDAIGFMSHVSPQVGAKFWRDLKSFVEASTKLSLKLKRQIRKKIKEILKTEATN